VGVLRITLEYDGTEFAGFQRQPESRTVQGALESALAGLLGAHVPLVAAGRTDAGCHARGQVVSVRCTTRIPLERMTAALNASLPVDVRVRNVVAAPDDFHARRSARARRYSYQLLDRPSPLWRRTAWWPRRAVQGERLARAAQPLAGEHDCAALQCSGSTPGTTRCRVHHAGWARWECGWRLDMVADHFLYRMVRTVVGTCLALHDDQQPERAMAQILESRDRRRAGPTAPPEGLCLEEVLYDLDGSAADPAAAGAKR
jgi:tRNA pseudouridine38-40 synthase